MSKCRSQTMSDIKMLCRMQDLNDEDVYSKSRLILSIYRQVCWSAIGRADEVQEELFCTYGADLDEALIYLETFAPDEMRDQFENRIHTLFETRWMIELVDTALCKVREYPERGDLYCEILNLFYLSWFKYTESEVLELLNMERSTYYDRKKEAILLFGLAFYGSSIPKLRKFLCDDQQSAGVEYLYSKSL